MRLNDPQIELVHDDPFMGYINEDTTVEDTTEPERSGVTEPASPPEVSTGEDAVPVTQPVLDIENSEEELDVGENSRTEAISNVQKSPTSSTSMYRPVEQQSAAGSTAFDRQPFVIVLLME